MSIKIIALRILKFLLAIVYAILKLLPTKKGKITFLSRQSDEVTKDFELVIKGLKAKNRKISIATVCARTTSGPVRFAFATLESMYHMATSEVVVLDAYWPAVSVLKHKKSLTVIQMWHALGKIKKSGLAAVGKAGGRSEVVAKEMRMHRGYDYIIAGGKAWNQFYCESFGCSEKKLVNCGLPRIDYMLSMKERSADKFFETYPQYKGKEIILYAPTFRRGYAIDARKLLTGLAKWTDRLIIVKPHPNQDISIPEGCDNIINPSKFTSAEVLAVSNYLITDYSAIAIEGAIMNVPTYYFVPDYEKYQRENGMNIDLFEEMPGCVFKDAEEVINALEEPYFGHAFEAYKEKFLPENLGTSTKQIVELIMRHTHVA